MKDTKPMTPNFDLGYDQSEAMKRITKGGYSYFGFEKTTIEGLAKRSVNSLKYNECCHIIQCLYPEFLVCSGLFDPFILFKVSDTGKRIDPPVASWRSLTHRQNEDRETTPFLIETILLLFKNNAIEPHSSWKELLETAKEQEERKTRR